MGEKTEVSLAKRNEVKKAFIQEFAQSLNFTAACEKLGVRRAAIEKWLDADSDFREAKSLCEVKILDDVEARVFKDAAREDNKLAMFLLRTRRREKYGNDNSPHGNVQLNVQVNLSEVVD